MVGSSAEVPAAESDSDFELNPSSDLVDVLQPESSYDFELSAPNLSDEFESTPLRPDDLGPQPKATTGLMGITNEFLKNVQGMDKKLQGRILEAITSILQRPNEAMGDTMKP